MQTIQVTLFLVIGELLFILIAVLVFKRISQWRKSPRQKPVHEPSQEPPNAQSDKPTLEANNQKEATADPSPNFKRLEALAKELNAARETINGLEKFKRLFYELSSKVQMQTELARSPLEELTSEDEGSPSEHVTERVQLLRNILSELNRSLNKKALEDASTAEDASVPGSKKETSELEKTNKEQQRITKELRDDLSTAQENIENGSIDKVDHLQGLLKESEQCIDMLEDDLSSAKDRISILNAQIQREANQDIRVIGLEANEKVLNDKLIRMQNELALAQGKVRSHGEAASNSTVQQATELASAKESSLEEARTTRQETEKNFNVVKAGYEAALASGSEAPEKIQALKVKLDSAERELEKKNVECGFLEQHYLDLSRSVEDIKAVQAEFDRLKEEYSMLEQQLENSDEDNQTRDPEISSNERYELERLRVLNEQQAYEISRLEGKEGELERLRIEYMTLEQQFLEMADRKLS